MAAVHAPIEVVAAPSSLGAASAAAGTHTGATHAYRPRPRALAAPAGGSSLERIRALTGAGATTAGSSAAGSTATPIALGPAEAADRILAAIEAWGYELPHV